jgi:hypothetical protein
MLLQLFGDVTPAAQNGETWVQRWNSGGFAAILHQLLSANISCGSAMVYQWFISDGTPVIFCMGYAAIQSLDFAEPF